MTRQEDPDSQVIKLPELPSLPSVAPGGSQPGGEDWIEKGYGGSWDPLTWSARREQFVAGKEAAKRKRELGLVVSDEGDELVVMHYGKEDAQGVWEWFLKVRGATIKVRDCRTCKPGEVNVRVELPSAVCMTHGGDGAVAFIEDVLRSLGYRPWEEEETLTRVDACADIYGLAAERLIELGRGGHAVRRAKQSSPKGEHFDAEGVAVVHSWQVGQSGVSMNIYAKERELREKPHAGKEAVLRQRWGIAADVPLEQVVAARVEFRLRRDDLRRLGIKTWRDWVQKRSQIINWLCTEWFRLLEEKPDRLNRHQDRGKLHPDWVKVIECFAQWVGRAGEPLERPAQRLPDLKRLASSCWGYVTSICARSGVAVTSVREAIELCVQLGVDECERLGRSVSDELMRKRRLFVAATGAVVIDPGEIPY